MASNATSTDEVPVIQVLEKEHYYTQTLVPLPSAVPYPPLAPSSLRLRTKILALSANTFTYARFGFLLNWWDVHPLPASTPAPYAEASKYGRINTWGWAEVLESTHPSVPAGSLLWGYQPIGTLAQDLTVRDADVPGQVIVTNEYRAHVMPIYNRYFAATGAAADAVRREIDARTEGAAYDVIVRVMFETAYLLNRYVLGSAASTPSATPSAEPWSPKQADIAGATIIATAPGSKVGLCFAHQLRYGRGEAERPARVIGLASEYSKSFVEGTGLYDAVVSTGESPVETLTKLGVGKQDKVVIVDFGGRGNVGATWAEALQPTYEKFLMLGVGSEAAEVSQADVLAGMRAGGPVKKTQVNASYMRDRAVEYDGADKYYKDLDHAWESLRKEGFKGLKMSWGLGMEDVKKGWDKLAKGEVASDEGLAFII